MLLADVFVVYVRLIGHFESSKDVMSEHVVSFCGFEERKRQHTVWMYDMCLDVPKIQLLFHNATLCLTNTGNYGKECKDI